MKRIFALLIVTIFGFTMFCTPVGAVSASKETKTTIEYLDNGDYIETIISEESLTRGTKTASKTKNYKNDNGEVMWSVTVRGTYTYDGVVALCTSCTHSTSTSSSVWTIKSSSSSRSGNTATANATATLKAGFISKDYSMSVKLSCSPDGTLS